MKQSKKQIYIIQKCNYIDQPIIIMMVTTSVVKLKSFIIKKIRDENSDIFYDNERMSKSMQVREFKSDWKILTREKINEKLYGIKYDYVYDGEEIDL
jgi:hypothetical protein